jgi:hypothetical protein
MWQVIRLIVLIILLLSPSFVWSKVVIRGKILHYDGSGMVNYHPVIEGIYTPYWKEVKPAANGTFRIEFESEGYGSMTVGYKGIRYRLFHDADSQIYLELDESKIVFEKAPFTKMFYLRDSVKQAATIKITGSYEHINRFYNRNMRSSYLLPVW